VRELPRGTPPPIVTRSNPTTLLGAAMFETMKVQKPAEVPRLAPDADDV
jgi:hypothetical protein